MAPTEPAIETIISGKHAMIDLWESPTASERRAARTILRRIECLPLANRPWQHLSQGERQRVLIGRALMPNPKLLILDEPCAGLDPVAREQFLQFLNRIARLKNSPALIFVTHHVEEIVPAFSHALLMKEGGLSAMGPLKETLTSKNLTESFDSPMRLRWEKGRYAIKISPVKDAI